MKQYRRAEQLGDLERITTVTEDGTYTVSVSWEGGTPAETARLTLKEMGWNSLQDFLRHRGGFRLVKEAEE